MILRLGLGVFKIEEVSIRWRSCVRVEEIIRGPIRFALAGITYLRNLISSIV